MSSWFKLHSHTLRRGMQIFTLLFLIAVPILNKYGIDAIVGTLYSIDILGWTIVDPAMLLQVVCLGELFPLVLLLGLLIPVLLALVAGRLFCSWMCPYNLLAEMLYKLKKRIIPVKKRKVRNPSGNYRWISLFTVFGTITLTGLPLIVILSMPGLISARIASFFSGEGPGLELGMISMLLVVDTFLMSRAWCKYLCPVGGLLGLVHNRYSLRVVTQARTCSHCYARKDHVCLQSCPLDLDPRQFKSLYPGCFNCLDCVNTCQQHGGVLNLSILKKTAEN